MELGSSSFVDGELGCSLIGDGQRASCRRMDGRVDAEELTPADGAEVWTAGEISALVRCGFDEPSPGVAIIDSCD